MDATMTTETMDLQALLEKTTDPDFLRHMIGFSAQRLMELEVEGLTGAAPGVRTPDWLNHRNGYRDRDWETRAGTVELRIPKLRKPKSGSWMIADCVRIGGIYRDGNTGTGAYCSPFG